jgi:DNA-binding PadR family transcriptional regulator
MAQKKDVWQGTLAVMVLKTLDTLGPLHGYGIARRIEQTSGDYKLTRAGKKQLEREAREWEQTTNILARFLSPGEEPS